jgi:hypothetical protein
MVFFIGGIINAMFLPEIAKVSIQLFMPDFQ